MTNSLNFHSSENVLISPSFLDDISPGYSILDTGFFFFFLTLEKYCATFFWTPWFLMRNLLSIQLFFLYGKMFFSGCFQDLFFCLEF